MRYIVGLTGGIGSGKSLCSSYFQQNGAFLIDSDSIGHSVLSKGKTAYERVISVFECTDENGDLDRKKLASIVFNDKDKLALLNSIVHPEVISIIKRMTEEYDGIIVLESALLFESGLCCLANEKWMVTADEDIRIKRIMARNHMSIKEAEERIRAQSDYSKYNDQCDVIIQNNGSPEELRHNFIKEYHRLLKRMADKDNV